MKPFLEYKNAEGVKYAMYFKKPTIVKYKNKKRIVTELDGSCESPDCKNPEININKKLGDRREMAVIIEEIVHSFFFDKLEKEVRPLASVITKVLYKKGWRKKKLK